MTPEMFLTDLIQLLNGVTYLAFATGATVLITSVLKRFIPAELVSAGTLALAVQVVLWVFYVVAQRYGLETQFKSLLDVLQILIQTFLLPAAGVAATSVASHQAYEYAKQRGVPFIGSQRQKTSASR